MPTLLEKSVPSSASPPPVILRSRHRWLRWRGALLVAIIGCAFTLGVVLLLGAKWHADHAFVVGAIWCGALAATALVSALSLRLAPATVADTARVLDQRYAAKNRLEAVAFLETSQSPLARAQRDETALHLQREPHPHPKTLLPWLVGLLGALLLAHLLTGIVWYLPMLRHATPPAAATPPPAKQIPKASLRWISPEAETKANPVEEVPTVAVADSTTGLRNVTLEVSLNGESKASTPIPAEPYDKPGTNKIKVSIYLDDLDAQPFDIVSYYLRGQRIYDGKLPDVASAIQFIQVRPFRDDVLQSSGHESKGYALLIRLKLAQLRAIKENFVLAHTDVPPDNPVRMAENTRVGKDQTELAAKTGEVIQAFIAEGVSADIISLLQQAGPFMSDAGKKILATQNSAATPPQEKALDYIVQVEKYFVKAMGPVSPGPTSDNPDDPFKEKQKHEMTKRLNAPAGQMEALATMQTHLSNDINAGAKDNNSGGQPDNSGTPASPPPSVPSSGPASPAPADKGAPQTPDTQAVDPFGPNAEKGTFAERQTRVAQGISVLLNGNVVFPPAVSDALTAAQRDAANSLRQLAASDEAAAREPAAAAARDLQTAVAAMNENGDQESRQALADAQQRLNSLAQRLSELAAANPPDASKQMNGLADQMSKIEQDLNNAADHQQQAGSAKGAQQLAALAEKSRQQQFASNLAQMAQNHFDTGRATALANQIEDAANAAAHGATPAQPSGQDYAQLVNALERTRANLEHLAEKASGHLPDGHDNGAGQQPEKTAGQGTAPTQTPGQGQGQQQAQAQGKGQNQAQSPGQGQGQGQAQGAGQTQGTGDGSNPSQAEANGSGNGSNGQNNGANGTGQRQDGGSATHNGNTGPEDVTGISEGTLRAYREALEDLKNQTQQGNQLLRAYQDGTIEKLILRYDHDTSYRPLTGTDIVHFYADLQKPLDALIDQLQAQVEHTQRTEIVKAPNLDDTPAAYRAAVSDYFEAMSRDYQPPPPTPAPPADNPKP